MLKYGGTTITLALAGTLLAVLPAGSAGAVDPTCVFTTGDVRTFDGSDSDSWADPDNWTPVGVPNDNTGDPTPETDTTYVCIPTGMTVYLDADELFDVSSGWVHLQGYWIGANATVQVRKGVALFNNDHDTASVTEETSLLEATSAYLGGEGTLRARGDVSVAASPEGGSTLTSSHPFQTLPSHFGDLVVEATGRLLLPHLGVNMQRRYSIKIEGQMVMTGTGFLAPNIETFVRIEPGGTYEFGGVGGFYEGGNDEPPGPNDTTLVNNGTLLKSGTGTTSLIGTDYSQGVNAEVLVSGGTLAFAGGTTYTAEVSGGQQLSTAQCAPRDPTQPCVEEKNPALDPQSVAFRPPGPETSDTEVQVRENAKLDFTAHAVGLPLNPADPALITFRLGAGPEGVNTTNPADVQIVHDNEPQVLPTCPASGLAPGQTNCVDRQASSYDAVNKNVIMVVRTIETSRYVCRKEDLTAPTIQRMSAPKVGLKKPMSVSVKMSEPGTVSVSGKVKAKGLKLSLKTVSVTTNASGEARVVLKLKKKQKKRLQKVRAIRGKAVLMVTATDLTGRTTTMPLTVTLT